MVPTTSYLYFEGRKVPKIKTKKAAAKRFKVRGSGSIKRGSANKAHILTKKNKARKNRLKKVAEVHPSDMSLVTRCLPNG